MALGVCTECGETFAYAGDVEPELCIDCHEDAEVADALERGEFVVGTFYDDGTFEPFDPDDNLKAQILLEGKTLGVGGPDLKVVSA
jgi:hypothetical protein